MTSARLRSRFGILAAVVFLMSAMGALAARYALVVGLNNYDPAYGANPLSCCVHDANGIRDTMLLADPEGRWQAGNITLCVDSQARKANIRAWLQIASAVAQPGDLVVYTQSSHGGRSTGMNCYLCAYDASYTDVELAADLALFNPGVNVIVIVDACHSGGLFKDDEGWPFAEQTMAAYKVIKTSEYQARGESAPRDLGANIGFMTACEYNEYSYEGNYYGVYTGCLLDACVLPSADLNQNGQFEFWELHYYAAINALTQKPQHAQYYNYELLNSLQARAVSGGGSSGNANAYPAYVYAYYGAVAIDYALKNNGADGSALAAAASYAANAYYFAVWACFYIQNYGTDFNCSINAYYNAYYSYLYSWHAYSAEHCQAAYAGAVYEYYSAVYSYKSATGQP